MDYSTTVNRADWRFVLDHAGLANVFHTPEYFDVQTSDAVGHKLLYMCCYDHDLPIGIIVGCENTSGYHQGWIEVGTKSGGLPLMIDAYDQRSDADAIKNSFIAQFANHYLREQCFLFYPCFHMREVIFDDPSWGCFKQSDSTVLLDLTPAEDILWKNLQDKGRNMVRAARRHRITTRIANDLDLFDQFYQHYKNLRTRLNTQYIDYKELRAKFDCFTSQGLADFWVAFLDDMPVAFNFIWMYKRMVNYVYNSSHPDYLHHKPNNLLQWDMICHYRQRGYILYNMWGVRNMNLCEMQTLEPERKIEGYGRFKLSFGGELKDLKRYVRLS